ncbi:hypothetical protein HYU11_02990 [Candidatus Woesearchaeota archaeon]|nr:hypothetical protein [Candidatus Woesearchaeota archaeon]
MDFKSDVLYCGFLDGKPVLSNALREAKYSVTDLKEAVGLGSSFKLDGYGAIIMEIRPFFPDEEFLYSVLDDRNKLGCKPRLIGVNTDDFRVNHPDALFYIKSGFEVVNGVELDRLAKECFNRPELSERKPGSHWIRPNAAFKNALEQCYVGKIIEVLNKYYSD